MREKTVREIAVENPSSIRVFETLGIDYCCGGKRSLDDACAHANIPIENVMALLSKAGEPHAADGAEVWNAATLSDLANHVVETHHGYVRRETPRITVLLGKVIGRHGNSHPEVKEIEELFN